MSPAGVGGRVTGGLSCPLSPQDAFLVAVLPKLFADRQIPTAVVSPPQGTAMCPHVPRGQCPQPQPCGAPQEDTSVSPCPLGGSVLVLKAVEDTQRTQNPPHAPGDSVLVPKAVCHPEGTLTCPHAPGHSTWWQCHRSPLSPRSSPAPGDTGGHMGTPPMYPPADAVGAACPCPRHRRHRPRAAAPPAAPQE